MPELPDWMRANVILGTDGTEYVPVLLALDGSMYAVLQGEYEGALRTVKLDDEGRLSAFVIDSTDAWARMLTIGNAELASRLGSMVTYDRRGQVQIVEDFENGIGGWHLIETGAGASVDISPLYFCRGGYSLRLTAGSTLAEQAGVVIQRGEMPAGDVGVEVAFSFAETLVSFSVGWFWYTGTILRMARATYDHTTNEIQVLDDGGVDQPIGSVTLREDTPGLFHRFKVVADLEGLQYVRVLLDDQEITPVEHAIWSDDIVESPYVGLECIVTGRALENDIVYIDDLIYTVAEP